MSRFIQTVVGHHQSCELNMVHTTIQIIGTHTSELDLSAMGMLQVAATGNSLKLLPEHPECTVVGKKSPRSMSRILGRMVEYLGSSSRWARPHNLAMKEIPFPGHRRSCTPPPGAAEALLGESKRGRIFFSRKPRPCFVPVQRADRRRDSRVFGQHSAGVLAARRDRIDVASAVR